MEVIANYCKYVIWKYDDARKTPGGPADSCSTTSSGLVVVDPPVATMRTTNLPCPAVLAVRKFTVNISCK